MYGARLAPYWMKRQAKDVPAQRWQVIGALVVASLLWGSLYPAARPAVAATGPMQVTLCRVLLAFVALGALILLRSGPGLLVQQLRAHWRAVLVLGVFNFAVSQILAMSAQSLLPASVNGLLNNTHPLWVAIASALFSPPRRPRLLVVGSAVALLGVVWCFCPILRSARRGRGGAESAGYRVVARRQRGHRHRHRRRAAHDAGRRSVGHHDPGPRRGGPAADGVDVAQWRL